MPRVIGGQTVPVVMLDLEIRQEVTTVHRIVFGNQGDIACPLTTVVNNALVHLFTTAEEMNRVTPL